MAMSPEQRQPLQDTVLRHLREHKVPVTVFLTNGVRLQGHVGAFDAYSVLLVRDRQAQVVYKHAIATIPPSEPVRTGRTDEPEPSPA
jgi:host factor-I protein